MAESGQNVGMSLGSETALADRETPLVGRAGSEVWRRAAAWSLTLLTIVALALAWFVADAADDAVIENALVTSIVILPLAIGHLVVRAQPRNAVGWLLFGIGLVLAMMALTDQVAANAAAHPDTASLGERLGVMYAQNYWPLLFVGFAGIAYVFPDGRFFNRRYRRWALAGGAMTLLIITLATFSLPSYEEPYVGIANPLAVLDFAISDAVATPILLLCLAALFAAAFSVRARLKASAGDRRLQMLWLAWAAVWIPGTLVLCLIDGVVFSKTGGEGILTVCALVIMATMMPVAIGIGILRYRLFDIELVINRTLVYGALTVIVAAVYAGVVAGFGAIVGSTTAAGVLGAGVVAVIVQPIHARIQRRVDRWVYGDRSDPYAALQRLDARLQETQAPDDVVQAVVDSVSESLRLPWSAVEFDRDGEGMTIAAHGVRGRGELERRELFHRGQSVGALAVEVPRGRPLSESDRRLLDQLASHVGPAVQSVRLTTELQQSRKELVTAREEERRRLRRDLHDGVGPSLAAMSLQLDLLRDRVGDGDAALVEQLGGQVQEAIVDIRRLVYELRPPALDQYGLVSALSEQASRMSTRSAKFTVDAPEAMPGLPAAVEVAVYRIALEGMTNAARHAGSSNCNVTISAADAVVVSVEDDGVGIDGEVAHGVGLRSMRERTAELGGDFQIAARAAGGTTLSASFPLERL
ncbi:MAG: histidine kinase [Solirubrobacterales bacterium]